jgi:hypothetical protein
MEGLGEDIYKPSISDGRFASSVCSGEALAKVLSISSDVFPFQIVMLMELLACEIPGRSAPMTAV